MIEGRVLNERYRIDRMIGGGGMANVYLAYDMILDREVAIKVLRLEYANDQEFIQRFDREAQAATSLAHPNIVTIYDVGEEENILYMVMEYVEGSTLKEYIQNKGPLPVEQAIHIMEQLTDAINHAHVNGLVHRDIKPQNILMDQYGNVKVTDFGIAIALSATSLTQTNSILGSVHYLSPEQARGGLATSKSDIYALGIVLFELLTGKVPFSGESPISIALKHLQNDTPSVRDLRPEIPQSVENIILQATAKDTLHRYQSVYEMEEALHMALDPSNANVSKYKPPYEEGEETKAIPIVTSANFDTTGDETMVRTDKGDTTLVGAQTPKEDGNPKKKKKRWKKFVYTFLLLSIIVAGLFFYFISTTPNEVEIPDLVGKEIVEAESILEDLNLETEQEVMYSEDMEEGYVIKSSPKKGRKVKETSIVKLYVSDGKEKLEMADYVGEKISQIEDILQELGFEEVIVYEKESDQPEGEIINQIQPSPGTEVVPSETKVIFEVSAGEKKITLNNLVGQSLEEAKTYADNNGLTLEVSEDYSNEVSEGKIMKQSPEANKEVKEGDTVKVTVSLGEEEEPDKDKSYSVTFTVPFNPSEDEDGEVPSSQKVEVYVKDKNTSMDKPLLEEDISKDEKYNLTLIIAPGEDAQYKVIRDGEEILNKTVSYKEGD